MKPSQTHSTHPAVQRLAALRRAMRAHGINAYVVPTADYNGSEYVAPYFRAREYFCGFTGSAGTLLVLETQAFLWTDGRYFTQAAEELAGSGVTLMRMGEPGVPDMAALLCRELSANAVMGLDGRTMDASAVRELQRTLNDRDIELEPDLQLLEEEGVWPNRPPMPAAPVWLLAEQYAGCTAAEKLAWLRAEMAKRDADVYVLCDPTDIAWLLNIRGGDCAHTPVPLCFCFVEKEKLCLCMDEEKRPAAVTEALEALGAEFRPYAGVYGYAHRYAQGLTALLTGSAVNYTLWDILCQNVIPLDVPDLVARKKAVKNPVEIQNLRAAHRRDGVALVRFMHWIKTHAGEAGIDEYTAGQWLDAARAEGGCLEPSFETICACGPNAAIVHYCAKPHTAAPIPARGLLLVDSGGHYYEGTTDVTRVYALGPLTSEERRHYTLVLQGMLHLMDAHFLADTPGEALDILAREPLWAEGLDYRHGTGHGVGYLLSVHEDPVRIRRSACGCTLAPGMVVSDEPGVYKEGSHGVRLENQLLCRALDANEYGRFLGFEPLTLAPIDLDAVEVSLLSERERNVLNAYHAAVCEALSPLVDAALLPYLRQVTRPI